jgi:hypothetical protein
MEIVVLLKKFELANPTDQITLCTKQNAEITFYEITAVRLETLLKHQEQMFRDDLDHNG